MSDEVLIKVENVGKKFCRSLKRSMLYGVEDIVRDTLSLKTTSDKLRPEEFWAVDDVSFEVRRGECLGIIGRNGAGKSTLLKMLNGIFMPDKGKITIKGKVGALIEVGAGFHPMLTGRENIYVNGAILGMSKREIDKKFDEIVAFAELEEFIDMPVKHYSSGMYVRLGFAIATSLKPDILILDEVLAVGDAAYRAKCYRRISECMNSAAVLFVSHNMEQLARISKNSLVLHSGRGLFLGKTNEGVEQYNLSIHSSRSNSSESFCKIFAPITIASIEQNNIKIRQGENLNLIFNMESEQYLHNCWVRVVFFNCKGDFSADIDFITSPIRIKRGITKINVTITNLLLKLGDYKLGINLFTNQGEILFWSYKQTVVNIINQNHVGNADYQPTGNVIAL